MIVIVRGGNESDIKPKSALDLVELNLRENGLVIHAQSVVATPIKGTRCNTAEVTHPRKGGADKTHHEVIHAWSTQSDFHTDIFPGAQFEVSDGFFALRDNWLLAGNQGHFINGILNRLFALTLGANGTVDDNFFELRNAMNVFQGKLSLQRIAKFFFIQSL